MVLPPLPSQPVFSILYRPRSPRYENPGRHEHGDGCKAIGERWNARCRPNGRNRRRAGLSRSQETEDRDDKRLSPRQGAGEEPKESRDWDRYQQSKKTVKPTAT